MSEEKKYATLYLNDDDLQTRAPEPNDIFLKGSLLHAVQMSDVLKDGKEFVDRPALFSLFTIQAEWNKLLAGAEGGKVSNEELLAFVSKYFGPSGWELEPCSPPDLKLNPHYLENFKHPGLKKLAEEIQEVWQLLGKKVNPEVTNMKMRTTMLYIPNIFVIPGGRFKVRTKDDGL